MDLPTSSLLQQPLAEALKARYVGKSIDELPTPSLLIDGAKLRKNCQQMLQTVEVWNCRFRAHIKTLKVPQAIIEQVGATQEKAIIVSTLAEAWGVVNAGLVREGHVKDILYGVPLGPHRLQEFLSLRRIIAKETANASVKALVDNVAQVEALRLALSSSADILPLDVFIKIDCGYQRAGLSIESPQLKPLIAEIFATPQLRIWGTYTHAGFSYNSKTIDEAETFLSLEIQKVNHAAELINEMAATTESRPDRLRSPLVLSVGSTPTAHAAVNSATVQRVKSKLAGELELHAGNYLVLDLQQVGTNAIPQRGNDGEAIDHCALSVLVTVISTYPSRAINNGAAQPEHSDGVSRIGDEALCDGGSIAFSKDTGPIRGHGRVARPKSYVGWQLDRLAQEHGILTVDDGRSSALKVGTKLQIIPQHACMTAAAHPWFFIVDSTNSASTPVVNDVWIPWKGW